MEPRRVRIGLKRLTMDSRGLCTVCKRTSLVRTQWKEALEHIEKAVELDPLSTNMNIDHGKSLPDRQCTVGSTVSGVAEEIGHRVRIGKPTR
jgi:hypothetical protein